MTLQISILSQVPTLKNNFAFPSHRGQLPSDATTKVFHLRRCRGWESRPIHRKIGKTLQLQSALQSSGASAHAGETSRTDEHNQEVEGGDNDRSQRYKQALKQIKEDISVRAEKLRSVNEAKKMNSELQFAKQLMAQDRFSQAVAHLDKVSARSTHHSLLYCEAELRRGICLEKLGMHSDAREALEGVAHTKAPFPHIRRRAAQELWTQTHAHSHHVEATSAQATEELGSEAAQAEVAANFQEYLYDMFSTGFGSLHDKELTVENEREQSMIRIIALSALFIGPAILGWLVMTNL